MFNRVRYSNWTAAAAAASLVTTVASLGVAETFTMSSTACVEPDGKIYYAAGNAENPSTSDSNASFRCPIFRQSADTNAITDIYVTVDDQHDDEGVECFAKSCDSVGGSCDNTATDTSSGTGNEELSLGSADGDPDGYVYLICSIPEDDGGDATRVYAYRWSD